MGNSGQVRFRPSAREIFPEIAGRSLTPRAEGKPSIEVPTAELPGIVTSDTAEIRSILLLRRQSSAEPKLIPLPREAAIEYFQRRLYPTPDIRSLHLPAIEVLAQADVYEFQYDRLLPAIHRLERHVEETKLGDSFDSCEDTRI